MTSFETERQKIMKRACPHLTDAGMHASLTLWNQLSKDLISILGQAGFQSVYARSVFVIKASFPWLAEAPLPIPDSGFSGLFECYKKRDSSEATSANLALLMAVGDALVSLIGESLTIRILRGSLRASGLDTVDMELPK